LRTCQRQLDIQHAEAVSREEFSMFVNGNNERLNDLKLLLVSAALDRERLASEHGKPHVR
jgi:hypothetical protein